MKLISNHFAIGFMLTLLTIGVEAQHLVSTRAGFLNRTEGQVFLVSGKNEKAIHHNDKIQLREGDVLRTGDEGYAELLLNPGSYLRVNVDTEIEAVNTEFNQIVFEVTKGSISIEASEVDKKMPIEIDTPNGTFFIPKKGLYRIDVDYDGTSVSVRQGEIREGTSDQYFAGKAYKIKSGKRAVYTGKYEPVLVNIDENRADAFDEWCFDRADRIMAANMYAVRRSQNILRSGWWYEPYYGFYTYVPYYDLYYTPYGFGFFYTWPVCRRYYYYPMPYSYRYPRIVIGYDYGYVRGHYLRRHSSSGPPPQYQPERWEGRQQRWPSRSERPWSNDRDGRGRPPLRVDRSPNNTLPERGERRIERVRNNGRVEPRIERSPNTERREQPPVRIERPANNDRPNRSEGRIERRSNNDRQEQPTVRIERPTNNERREQPPARVERPTNTERREREQPPARVERPSNTERRERSEARAERQSSSERQERPQSRPENNSPPPSSPPPSRQEQPQSRPEPQRSNDRPSEPPSRSEGRGRKP